MATIDKNKIIEAATKFVQKGQYDKAIKEYLKLLETDAKDARIQQKLGELYQKKGDNALAAGHGGVHREVAFAASIRRVPDAHVPVRDGRRAVRFES